MITDIFIILMGITVVFILQKNRSKISHLIKAGIRTEGVVVDHATAAANNNNSAFPVVRFTTNQEQSLTITSKEGFLPGRVRKGKKLVVLYNPANPQQDYAIELPKEKLMYYTVLCGGILFIVAGTILLLNQLDIIHLLKK
jgi:hypothetical protein